MSREDVQLFFKNMIYGLVDVYLNKEGCMQMRYNINMKNIPECFNIMDNFLKKHTQ